jgi:hypothetical protein
MNAELTKRTLVVSERPTAVELRQGFSSFSPSSSEKEISRDLSRVGHGA